MPNKFLQPGEQRAAAVEDLFAVVAPRYDLINDLQSLGLHRRWKRRVVKLADVQRGERALDICCGTGDLAFALNHAGAEVTALDFSPAMLVVAEQRAREMPGHSVTFLRGDAMQLPFPDESFDIITIGYGLRNLADWERGIGEMWRVARPGARILVLDFGKPDNRFWRSLYYCYLRTLVPLFGKIFCKDSDTHAYIYASLQNYPAQHGVAAKMTSLHCSNVQIHHLIGGAMSINFGQKPGSINRKCEAPA